MADLIKEMIVKLLYALAKETDNTLDDKLVEAIAAALGIELED